MNSPAAAIISTETPGVLDQILAALANRHAARAAVLAGLGLSQENACRQATEEMEAARKAEAFQSRKRSIACRIAAMAKEANQL